MDSNQLYLFKDKRFLPIFIIQFCGCLNDNIIKNALIILITYKLSNELKYSPQFLVLIANTFFILPFILFASLAGQIADRYERSTLVRIIKFCEIGIVITSIYGFINTNLIILFSCVGLMGIHSAFFGPIKYSVLPDHLKREELLGANGLVEAGTFISILFGTIIGGFYNFSNSVVIIIALMSSIIGVLASFFLPKSNNTNVDIKINLNLFKETINIVKYTYSKKQVYLAILGISWFWCIGAAILALIPSLTKDLFKADENVANLFLATFSIGVGVGSFLCNKILHNEITTKYVFISALGLSIFGIDLFFASRISSTNYEPEQLKSILVFLSKKHNWRIVIDLFCFSSIGGIYVVPLFAFMQYFSSAHHRSRVIAANNLINSIFMAGSTVFLSLLFKLGFTIPYVILIFSLLNIIVTCYIYKLLPEAKTIPLKITRAILKFVFDTMYNVEVKNIENFHKAGSRSVVIANHLSYIDPALLAVYLPSNLTFAINTTTAKMWWVRPFLKVVKALPVDPNNALAIKTLIDQVKKNNKVAIFPEGRISTTGSLMKIYEGPGMITDKTNATILPIRIEGTEFTHFSKLRNILKSKIFPKVTITILPPVKIKLAENIDGRLRRKFLGQALYDIMAEMMFEGADYKKTIFQSLIEASKLYGKRRIIMQDIDNTSLTYKNLLIRSFILGNLISRNSKEREYVGIMLPNMVSTAMTFYAMQSVGRVPTMINFTLGSNNIINGCKTAGVKTIYTSKKFIYKADLHELAKRIEEADIKLIYLEDLRKEVTFTIKLKAYLGSFIPYFFYNNICTSQQDTLPAVILFTSGSEGSPKAVALSHRNLQANRYQIMAKVDFGPHDIAFNALPMFHCFGLTAAILMSLNGIKTFFYPSPLHYRIIPEVIYDIGATIMFGTDTFLRGYANYAHPYDFYSLRYIFAGAEKLRSHTRQLWLNKYGIRIFEGYGVTEASPVVAANTSMHDCPGTVGRFLPKIEYFLKPVEGIKNGGRLFIKGPNIMLGYISSESPGIIKAPAVPKLGKGWYDTGDIVSVDEEGYITILGRAKRFAKLAGEMISLQVIEDLAFHMDMENIHCCVYIEDNKGEQIILFTTSAAVDKKSFSIFAKEQGMSELYIPKFIIKKNDLPLLATGKADYTKLTELAKEYVKDL